MTGTQQQSSACLIEAARTDKMAFSALFRRHYDEIFRYCARRLPDRSHAEDVTSQVFLKMVKNFDSFTGDETGFRCWLFRIACNEINSFYRKSSRHSKAIDKLRQQSNQEEHITEDDFDYENQDKIDFLKTAIETLKPDHQNIVTLRFFQGLNSEQIGEVMNMNPATVRSQLSRSLKKLKKQFRLQQQQTAEEIFSYD
ncbi:MAG: RNA polymerase sigma factor [Planctomycetota bacterium]